MGGMSLLLARGIEHIHFEAYEDGFVVENTWMETIP